MPSSRSHAIGLPAHSAKFSHSVPRCKSICLFSILMTSTGQLELQEVNMKHSFILLSMLSRTSFYSIQTPFYCVFVSPCQFLHGCYHNTCSTPCMCRLLIIIWLCISALHKGGHIVKKPFRVLLHGHMTAHWIHRHLR